MLDTIPVMLLVGSALGFLAGLGVGGGSLLILWLTLVLGFPHSVARTINLLFFLPSAIVACLFRWKQGTLDFKKVTPAIICGCVAAAVFARISFYIDVAMIKKLFGLLLLLTGVRELCYRPRKAK